MADATSNSTVKDDPKKAFLDWVSGLPDNKKFLNPRLLEQALSFAPAETDIFVVSYPKSGSTWLQYIVWEMIHKGAPPPSPNKMKVREFPSIDSSGTEMLRNLPPPRLMKTHLPFNINPYNPETKYIYVVRNPWDCCVSYFHQFLTFGIASMDLDEFVDSFIKGQVGWGDFFDHALSWYEHKDDPNVFFLTYEGMKADKRKTILDVAKFLGEEYYSSVLDEEVMQNCLKHTDFQYMKQLGFFYPKAGGPLKDSTPEEVIKAMGDADRQNLDTEKFEEVGFFRKGVVGDWKNHLNQRQLERFNAHMSMKLKNTKMENFWKPVVQETSL